jgi:7-keto-8-aminopelargonate synthetase-like enzyme
MGIKSKKCWFISEKNRCSKFVAYNWIIRKKKLIYKKKKKYEKLKNIFKELQTIEDNGILKRKNYITQGAEITISTGETVLNFCSNNYLSSHPEVVQAQKIP